jgi:hypothetical protein
MAAVPTAGEVAMAEMASAEMSAVEVAAPALAEEAPRWFRELPWAWGNGR